MTTAFLGCICCEGLSGSEEGPLFNDAGAGPFCRFCLDECVCNQCEGTGLIFVKRDSKGRVDYLSGRQTGETDACGISNTNSRRLRQCEIRVTERG